MVGSDWTKSRQAASFKVLFCLRQHRYLLDFALADEKELQVLRSTKDAPIMLDDSYGSQEEDEVTP